MRSTVTNPIAKNNVEIQQDMSLDFGIQKINSDVQASHDFTLINELEEESSAINSLMDLCFWAKQEHLELLQLAECIKQYQKMEIKVQQFVIKNRVAKSDLYMIDESLGSEKYVRKKFWRGSSTKLDNMNPNDIEINDSLRDDPS